MLSAAGQRATGAMHRALTAYDLQSAAAVEGGSKALVRSMSLVSLDSSGRGLAPGSALSSRVARLLDGTLVYYADADGGPSPFTVQLDDFRMAGGTSRVCHLSTATRALDLASLVAREEGLERPPRLFLEGAELPPDALVCRIARPGSVVLLVPQLTELISFFVSKVALARPASPLVEAVTDAKPAALSSHLLSALSAPVAGGDSLSRLHPLPPLRTTAARPITAALLSPGAHGIARAASAPAPRPERRADGAGCGEEGRAEPGCEPAAPGRADGDVRSIVNYRGKALADSSRQRQQRAHPDAQPGALDGCGGGGCLLGGAHGASGPCTQLHVLLRDTSELPRLPADAGARLLGPRLLQMVRSVGAGLDSGRQPELIADGLGGAYYLHDAEGRLVGIFKPIDEEPYAPANPKGLAGSLGAMGSASQARAGVSVGRAAQRECAAFLLDHGSWAGVPHTAMLWVLHTAAADGAGRGLQVELKSGSFQRYVPHSATADELGPAQFGTATAQRVAAFDIRVCNSDRHAGNLLVQRQADRARERADAAGADGGGGDAAAADDAEGGGAADGGDARCALPELHDPAALTVVPIDHGFILPHYRMLGELNFEWAAWPQAAAPLSAADAAYVAALDSQADAAMLRTASSLPEECLLSLHLGTMLLQMGVAAGLSLAQIARLAMRDGRQPSALERAVEEAEGAAEAEAGWVVPLQLPGQLTQPPQPPQRLRVPDAPAAPPGSPLPPAAGGSAGARAPPLSCTMPLADGAPSPEASPPLSPSPIESPLLRESSGAAQPLDRAAWEASFLSAARRFLACEIERALNGERRGSGAHGHEPAAGASPRAIPRPPGGAAGGGGSLRAGCAGGGCERFLPCSFDSMAGTSAERGGSAGGSLGGSLSGSLGGFSHTAAAPQCAGVPLAPAPSLESLPLRSSAQLRAGRRELPASPARALGGFGGLGSGGALRRGPAAQGGAASEPAAPLGAPRPQPGGVDPLRLPAAGPGAASAGRQWAWALPRGKAWADLESDEDDADDADDGGRDGDGGGSGRPHRPHPPAAPAGGAPPAQRAQVPPPLDLSAIGAGGGAERGASRQPATRRQLRTVQPPSVPQPS